MYILRLLTAMLLLAVAAGGCSQVQTTASSPETSTPNSQVAGGSATLTWDAPTTNTNGSPITDLAGYYIYYGSSANTLTQVETLADPQALSYVVNGLTSGTWYFAVQAYDSAGNRSALSNIESKTF